jgi:hypothetical protein
MPMIFSSSQIQNLNKKLKRNTQKYVSLNFYFTFDISLIIDRKKKGMRMRVFGILLIMNF